MSATETPSKGSCETSGNMITRSHVSADSEQTQEAILELRSGLTKPLELRDEGLPRSLEQIPTPIPINSHTSLLQGGDISFNCLSPDDILSDW